jgi:hypothetical protein
MIDRSDRLKAAIPWVLTTLAVALSMGLTISLVGTLPWVELMRLNVREHPELPWAAATTAGWLPIMLVWLSGRGWPRSTSRSRRTLSRRLVCWCGDQLSDLQAEASARVAAL